MPSIFCDGACSGNGTKRAFGGWAWAYWSGAVAGEPAYFGAGKLQGDATNQRAELTALLEAIQWAAKKGHTTNIYSDSQYAINCTTKWGPGWKRKGWTRASGEPLQNLDLIKQLVDIWKPCWPLHHVRGHQTGCSPEAHGNNWVDRAAVAAAHGKLLVLDIPEPDVIQIDYHEKVPVPLPVPKPVARNLKQSDIRNWFS